MPRLEIRTGRLAGKSFDLTKTVILGRGDTADVQMPDGKMSREHCRVFKQAGKWSVADLNSRNGINVNGLKATRKDLFDGDVIEVGETQIAFLASAAAAGSGGGGPRTVQPQTVQPMAQPGEIDVEELDLGGDEQPAAPAAPPRRPQRAAVQETRATAPATSKRPAASSGRPQSAKDAAFAAARAQAASKKASSSGRAAPTADGIQVSHKVLQFSKVDAKSANPLAIDLTQYSALTQLLIWCGVVGVLIGVVYMVFKLMSDAAL